SKAGAAALSRAAPASLTEVPELTLAGCANKCQHHDIVELPALLSGLPYACLTLWPVSRPSHRMRPQVSEMRVRPAVARVAVRSPAPIIVLLRPIGCILA